MTNDHKKDDWKSKKEHLSNEASFVARQNLFLRKIRERTERLSNIISAESRAERVPLSYAQQQLWFVSSLDSHASRSYNESIAFNIRGFLDIDALRRAYQTLTCRHEILSTIIQEDEFGTPYQAIQLDLPAEITLIDYSNIVGSHEKREHFRAYLKAFSEKNFDFSSDRLIRASIVRMDETYHVLVLVLHHIIMDGWSMEILVRELSLLYRSETSEQAYVLPALKIQYADYALWQQKHFKNDHFQKEVDYWRNKLRGVQNLGLPNDRNRPNVPSYIGGWVPFEISHELESELLALSKSFDVTLFVTLLSIYKVFLYQYSQQQDICVGTPVANRIRPELGGLIGLFVNTLALRTEICSGDTFYTIVNKVKLTVTNAFAHQELPFERVVSSLKTHRDQSITPVFQTMFVFQNIGKPELKIDSAEIDVEYPENIYSKFDLSFYLYQEPDKGIRGGIEYATDLFFQDTIERFGQNFVELCRNIVAFPYKQIGELEFVTEKEKYQLLINWNDNKIPYPQEKCIHELFEEQVHRTPGATAIVFKSQKITYRELNERANRLSHYLIEQGVEPGVKVGLFVERSPDMIIGMLAILKSGAAYVPLDPDYPHSRIAFMREDAALDIVLTQICVEKKKKNRFCYIYLS